VSGVTKGWMHNGEKSVLLTPTRTEESGVNRASGLRARSLLQVTATL
jgi:hypothetical protein